jgi:hypothetical protein
MTIEKKRQARFGEPMPEHLQSLDDELQGVAYRVKAATGGQITGVVPREPVRQSEQSSLADWDRSDSKCLNALGGE